MKLTQIEELEKGRFRAVLPVATGLPVWVVEGTADGPTLVLTAGVHGCEYVGILTARRLFDRLSPATLSGRVILLPMLNGEGFYHGSKQIVPTDGKNLNRVFPPPQDGTISEQIAKALVEQIYPEADFLLDLHGGDVNEAMSPLVFFPATASPSVTARSLEAASHLMVNYRIPSSATNGVYSFAAQTGIPSLLMEVGGLGLWQEEEIDLAQKSIESLMGYLGMGPTAVLNRQQKEASRMCYVEADSDGLWFPAVAKGAYTAKGELLGRLESLDGHILKTVTAPFDGMVLYHTVSLGVRVGDSLVAYGCFQ